MITKNDNIPFLEGYFISKRGRLWSRYERSSTSVFNKRVLFIKIKFLYLYNENKY